jgi:hypothetical protein
MFYTDTNGQTPQNRCLALILLEAAMETRLPYELNIEGFNELRSNIDNLLGIDHKLRFEE